MTKLIEVMAEVCECGHEKGGHSKNQPHPCLVENFHHESGLYELCRCDGWEPRALSAAIRKAE